jgi:pimeloyl-ACP methyl ester carboxylesterase
MKRWLLRVGIVAMLAVVGLVVVVCLAGALYTPELRVPAGLSGRYLTLGGLALRVKQEGQGRDVLLIHGSPGSLEDFAPITAALRGSFRFTSYDRPGHGYSADGGRYDLTYNAEIARALMDQLGLTRAIVVGHSYGGSTALALALQRPARASAYVVIDSAIYRRVRPEPALYRVLALPTLGVGLASLLPEREAARRIQAGLEGEFAPSAPPAGFVALRRRVWTQPKVTHALAVESVAYDRTLAEQAPRYASIRAPLYVLAQRDQPVRRENAERLAREVPGAELRLVEQSGHFIQFQRPDAVIDAIRRAAAAH